MAKGTAPAWHFSTRDGVLTVRLVGYRGGQRQTYALDTLTVPYTKEELTAVIAGIQDLVGARVFPIGRMKGEQT